MVDPVWAFSGALRQQWCFYSHFCIPRNFHSLPRSRSSCWSTFCFKVWEEYFSTIWSLIIFSKVPKSQDFNSSQRLVERLICLLCSRPEFVAFCYHIPFWGNIPIQGCPGLFKALVFAREHIGNALHCNAALWLGTTSPFLFRSDAIA